MKKFVSCFLLGAALLSMTGCKQNKAASSVHHSKTVKVEKAKHAKKQHKEKQQKRNKKKTSQKAGSQEKQASNQTNSQQQANGQQLQGQQNRQQPQMSQSKQTVANSSQSATANPQLPPSANIHDFVNKYGVSPALWLHEHGLSTKQALEQTPDDMKTSGEKQTQFAMEQGRYPY